MTYVIQSTDDPPFVTCAACDATGEYQSGYCGACDGAGEIALDMTRLDTLSHNLAIAAGHCRAFKLGGDEAIGNHNMTDAYEDGTIATIGELKAACSKLWFPGCGRSAP